MADEKVSNTNLRLLQQSLNTVIERLGSVEAKLEGLSTIELTIDRVITQHENSREQVNAQWRRLEEIDNWKEVHRSEEHEERRIMMKTVSENTAAVEKLARSTQEEVRSTQGEVDNWVNRGRGAFWMGTLLFGLLQTLVIGFGMLVYQQQKINTLKITTLEVVVEAEKEAAKNRLRYFENKMEE